MTVRRPGWAWLLFPHLAIIIAASTLAACRRLPALTQRGGLDKLAHFVMLGLLSLFAVSFFGRARWLRVVLVLAVSSAAEELSQAWFPARTLDVWDLTANLLGITLGGLIAWTVVARADRRFLRDR
jgi:VanZ family protein